MPAQHQGARVNVLGLTFKEDVRTSAIPRSSTSSASCTSSASRPSCTTRRRARRRAARVRRAPRRLGLAAAADALILAVAHRKYLELPSEALLRKVVRAGCLIDVKSCSTPPPSAKKDCGCAALSHMR